MQVAELFQSMPDRLDASAAAGMNKTLQWNITGDEAGVWAIQIDNGVGQLIPGGVEKPDVTFTISGKDWLSIAEGKLDGMRAFMSGKLKVNGDMKIGMQMSQLFPVQNA